MVDLVIVIIAIYINLIIHELAHKIIYNKYGVETNISWNLIVSQVKPTNYNYSVNIQFKSFIFASLTTIITSAISVFIIFNFLSAFNLVTIPFVSIEHIFFIIAIGIPLNDYLSIAYMVRAYLSIPNYNRKHIF